MSDVPDWFAKLFWGGDIDGNDCDAKDAAKPLWIKLTDHIRAVIADEAAKAQPAEPVGDVPEKIGNPLWDAFLAAMSAAFDDGIARTKDKHKGYVTVASRWWPQLTRRVAEAERKLIADRDAAVHNYEVATQEADELRQQIEAQAEATAERDRRIAELESDLKHADNRNESRKRWTAQKERQIVEKDKRIAELEAEHRDLLESIESAYTKLGLHEGNVPPKEKISDTLHQAIDALKQQLATATAEVERLKGGNWTPEEVNNICHNLHGVVSARGFADGCALEQQRLYGCAPDADEVARLRQQLAEATAEVSRLKRDAEQGQAVAEVANMHGWNGCEHSKVLSVHIADELTELAKLREEVARLTRPVEGVEELVELTCKESFVSFDAVSWLSVKSLMANAAKKAIQRERAARLAADKRATAAEAERDELREFVRTRIIESWYRNGDPVFHDAKRVHIMSDANLDELLTAYRAEKGKVTK